MKKKKKVSYLDFSKKKYGGRRSKFFPYTFLSLFKWGQSEEDQTDHAQCSFSVRTKYLQKYLWSQPTGFWVDWSQWRCVTELQPVFHWSMALHVRKCQLLIGQRSLGPVGGGYIKKDFLVEEPSATCVKVPTTCLRSKWVSTLPPNTVNTVRQNSICVLRVMSFPPL